MCLIETMVAFWIVQQPVQEYNWAMTCDFQQCAILTSVDSDEPEQPPVKLRSSKCCSVSSLKFVEFSSDKLRPWSDCAYAQAGLSLCWSHIAHCWKSHATAHMVSMLLYGDVFRMHCINLLSSPSLIFESQMIKSNTSISVALLTLWTVLQTSIGENYI